MNAIPTSRVLVTSAVRVNARTHSSNRDSARARDRGREKGQGRGRVRAGVHLYEASTAIRARELVHGRDRLRVART